MKPIRNASATTQRVGDDLLVLHRGREQVHHLNPVAFWIFEHCNGDNSVEQIVASLVEHFDVAADVAERDVRVTIEQLMEIELIMSDSNDREANG